MCPSRPLDAARAAAAEALLQFWRESKDQTSSHCFLRDLCIRNQYCSNTSICLKSLRFWIRNKFCDISSIIVQYDVLYLRRN